MLRKFWLIPAVFALGVWALAPSAASADGGHRDGGKGQYYKEKYDEGEYEWDRDRHDRRREYKHYRKHPRHARRNYDYRPRHGRRSFEKYVFDDGYCRTTYKYGRRGSKYAVRCRDRNYYPRRPGRYERHGADYVIQRDYVAQAMENASDGQAIVWNDSRKRTRYEVVPTQSYQVNNGRYCREYLSTATVGGRTREVYGKACRQEDGSWELVR
jgi:17 kDa outer membrane surface antigen